MAAIPDLERPNLHVDVPIKESFDVREFTVDDGLSSLFSVDLEVVCPNAALDFEELVGQPAAFHIELDVIAYAGASKRSWSGVISTVGRSARSIWLMGNVTVGEALHIFLLDEARWVRRGSGAMRFLALGLAVIAIGWPTVSYAEA
jgi:hypothetical protein